MFTDFEFKQVYAKFLARLMNFAAVFILVIASVLPMMASATGRPTSVYMVSDIDDSIKASHVLSRWGSIANAYDTSLVFRAMPELYKMLAPLARIDYVSKAPQHLMLGSHSEFLNLHEFPGGSRNLHLADRDRETFKLRKIQELLNNNKSEDVIFIGDNAEQDPQIYDQLAKQNPGRRFHVFIRMNYPISQGTFVRPNQVGFVTAAELALHLSDRGLISQTQALRIARLNIDADAITTLESDLDEGSDLSVFKEEGFGLGLPSWIDCRDHKISLPTSTRGPQLVENLVRLTQLRCKL